MTVMSPTEPTADWLGLCSEHAVIHGLFDTTLTLEAPLHVAPGDVVQVTRLDTGPQISVVAPAGSAMATVYRILQQHALNPLHPPAVTQAAQKFLPFKPETHEGLVDLTDLPFVTIDNEDSKDLDQALYVDTDSDGYHTVYYALADAAWFIKPDTPLFSEALKRGVTYYAPSLAVTMLPAVLSEGIISLNPDVLRRALVFRIRLNADGSSTSCDVYRGLIRSRAKLSYAGVQTFYDAEADKATHDWHSAQWAQSLRALKTVGELRLTQAELRDVVNYNRRESRVSIDPEDPERFVISVRERLDAELYNEQISLLCNIEGARVLMSLDRMSPELQAIYRVHLPPLRNRIREFRNTLNAIIHTRGLDSRWQWDTNTTLADYIDGLPATSTDTRIRQAIERLVMMTNRASGYAAEPDIHHALSVDAYARFSSPMREMVGVFTHKELSEALEFEPSRSREEDAQYREQIIESANLAKTRQRKIEKAFQLEALQCFLKQDLTLALAQRPARAATITGMRGNRVYAHVDGFAMDIKIYLDDLGERCGCHYEVDQVSARPSVEGQPEFVIGDGVTLTTQRWCPEKNRYLFDIEPL